MDAAARRRELRKRKILQNAEDRIKKLTGNVGANVKHDKDSDTDNALKLDEHQNVNYSCSKPSKQTEKFDQNFETRSHGEKILQDNSFKYQDGSLEIQDKTDGHVIKEGIHEAINAQLTDESRTELVSEPRSQDEANTTLDSKRSKVRSVVVIVFSTLCFAKSLYLPAISWTLGSPWYLQIYNDEKASLIIPFCFLELVLFFTPSIRKVTPGKQVNIWLLALKLCGVSPVIIDTVKIVILEILEFLTDLAMFIFVLVILQNVKELQ